MSATPNTKGHRMHFITQFFTDLQMIGVKEIGIIAAILVMDAALSGDNSIAITALAQNLHEKDRNRAVWLGMVVAGVLRFFALAFAAFIMTNPWVQILGGLYLIKLCVSHFRKAEGDEDAGHKTYSSFARVLVAIGILDLSLSLDNVVAVVAMSKNLAVVVLGVMASIAMLAVATQLTRRVMKRYHSLESAAYIILAFLGTVMLIEHGPEFVVWCTDKLVLWKDKFQAIHIHIGEVGEILGVVAIVSVAILIDELRRRKERKLHSLHSHETSTVAVQKSAE